MTTRYGKLTTEKEFICVGRSDLIEEIFQLRKEIRDLRAAGLRVKGWWCMHCYIFNGEEKEALYECRACDRPKTPPPPNPEDAG
jgi:hypothetical protein